MLSWHATAPTSHTDITGCGFNASNSAYKTQNTLCWTARASLLTAQTKRHSHALQNEHDLFHKSRDAPVCEHFC